MEGPLTVPVWSEPRRRRQVAIRRRSVELWFSPWCPTQHLGLTDTRYLFSKPFQLFTHCHWLLQSWLLPVVFFCCFLRGCLLSCGWSTLMPCFVYLTLPVLNIGPPVVMIAILFFSSSGDYSLDCFFFYVSCVLYQCHGQQNVEGF